MRIASYMTTRLCSLAVLFALAAGMVATVAAPAAAQGDTPFADVPDDAYYTVPVTELADDGVFAGTLCDAGFCPGEPMDRATMAVWMVRVLDGQDPKAVSQTRFNDADPAGFHAPFIERMAELGVTGGCGDGTNYCPDRAVPRAEMAVFLTRGFDLAEGPDPGFSDVSSDAWYATAVAALAASGITGGCGDGTTFCPSRDTTRAQMATFLHRALTAPPTARFTAVDIGDRHACAIRIDKTVVCWGANDEGQAAAPDGQFSAIAAGFDYTCGLRLDSTAECWGRWRPSETPSGRFSAIVASNFHMCGLRTSHTITCWGSSFADGSEPPTGQFNAVTTGGIHACGLRNDHTITCWGNNNHGQSNPPTGQFNAVTTGGIHACGLRNDHTITCWGNNNHGQTEPPTGQFSAVAASREHSCGLRAADHTITCWGNNNHGQIEPPTGQFSAVATGGWHGQATCGLRTNGTIACWGGDLAGWSLSEPPTGKFSAVTTGDFHACGLRTNGTIACWGNNNRGQSDPPSGQFSSIYTGASNACGLRADGTIACWGDHGRPPSGQFSTMDIGTLNACGLRTDRTIACWGRYITGQSAPPEGQFSTIDAGLSHSCGLRTDNTIACWGYRDHGQSAPPEGQFSTIDTGLSHSCGLRTDNTIACWGNNDHGQSAPPTGEFSAVTTGGFYTCGLRTDNTIACWGNNDHGQSAPPTGEFSAVTTGDFYTCGLRTDNTIACWGNNDHGQSAPPTGEFNSVATGQSHACGLRTDGTITCWGAISSSPPAGVEFVPLHDSPKPQACRLYGSSVGFPRRRDTPSTGTVRIPVLFVDFHDAPSDMSTHEATESGLVFAEQYLEASSYGQLDVEFVPLHRWLRAEHNSEHYLILIDNRHQYAPFEEALRLADEEFDFTGFDIVLILHSRGGGLASVGPFATEERHLTAASTAGIGDRGRWGAVAAHELAHNLGLPDLYPYNEYIVYHLDFLDQQQRDAHGAVYRYALDESGWTGFNVGLMGFSMLSPPDSLPGFRTPEMLAWSRWQLGWLKPAQVRCITDRETVVTLSPVAAPGDGTAMAAIPASRTEAIVIESRRPVGYDNPSSPVPVQFVIEGSSFTFGAGSDTAARGGVLVYMVDSSHPGGFLPIKSAGLTHDAFAGESPLLFEGDSITVHGYRIALKADDGVTHTVNISKVDPATESLTARISSLAPPTVNGSFDVAITFNQPVAGFEPDDILVIRHDDPWLVLGGTVSSLSGSNREFNATIVPDDIGEVTEIIVSVRPGAVHSSSGRPNTIPEPITRKFVPPGPTVTITSSAPETVRGSFDVTVTFSEPVTGFQRDDIAVMNGSVSNLSGSGSEYTATITPDDIGNIIHVTVSVSAGAALDRNGDPNWVSETLERQSQSTGGPTVTLSSSAPQSVQGSFDVTITFSAPVTGLDQDRIVVINGTATPVSGSGAVYTVTVTPGSERPVVLVFVVMKRHSTNSGGRTPCPGSSAGSSQTIHARGVVPRSDGT